MKKPVVKVNPITGMITVNGMVVDVDVLAAIFSAPARVLWRFQIVDDELKATAFDERQVIWLDPTPTPESK